MTVKAYRKIEPALRPCQVCAHPRGEVPPYQSVCEACWDGWMAEYRSAVPDGEPPARQGIRLSVRQCQCAACGQIFGSLLGFTRHRVGVDGQEPPFYGRRCSPPSEIAALGFRVKGGVWKMPLTDVRQAALDALHATR